MKLKVELELDTIEDADEIKDLMELVTLFNQMQNEKAEEAQENPR